jgi:hypothetical protein
VVLDELPVHGLDALEDFGGLVDFAEGDLELVVVVVLLLVLGEQVGEFFDVGLGEDVGAEPFEFLDGGLDGPA